MGNDKNHLYGLFDLQKDQKEVAKRRTQSPFSRTSDSLNAATNFANIKSTSPALQIESQVQVGDPYDDTKGTTVLSPETVSFDVYGSNYTFYDLTVDTTFIFADLPTGRHITFILDILVNNAAGIVITLPTSVLSPPILPGVDGDHYVLYFTGVNRSDPTGVNPAVQTFEYIGGSIGKVGAISVAILGLSAGIGNPVTGTVINFNSNEFERLGTGITDETATNTGVFKLSGAIFQLNSSVSITGNNDELETQWEKDTVIDFTNNPTLIGRSAFSINSNSPSNSPISTAFVDATSADVFVRLIVTDDVSVSTVEVRGTWGQIFSLGGGSAAAGGGGDVTFPILYPQEGITSTGVLEIISISGSTGQNKRVTLDQNFQFSFDSLPSDTLLEEIWLTFLQDGTGNHSITGFPSNLKNGSQLNVLLDKTANSKTTFHFITEDNGDTFRAELIDLTGGGTGLTEPIILTPNIITPQTLPTTSIVNWNLNPNTITLDRDIEFSFANLPPSGKYEGVLVIIDVDGTGGFATPVWPASLLNPPNVSTVANTRTSVMLYTIDGGNLVTNATSVGSSSSGGQNQTPWLSDIDAAEFDLTNLSNLEFKDASTGPPAAGIFSIFVQSNSLVLNSGTTDIDFRITSTNKMVLDATKLEFRDGVDILPTNTNNNDIGATGKVFENVFVSNIILETTPSVPAATVYAMFVQDGSFVLNTISTNEFDFRVAGANKVVLNATELNLSNDVDITVDTTDRNDIGAEGLEFANIFVSNVVLKSPTPSVPAATKYAMFVQDGSFVLNTPSTEEFDFRVGAVNKMVLDIDSLTLSDDVDILVTTVATNDLGSNGLEFANLFLENLVLDTSSSVPAATVYAMFVQDGSFVLNTISTEEFDFRVAATNKMILNATSLTLRDDVDILVTTTDTNDIGATALPFANVFTSNVVLTSPTPAVPAAGIFSIFVQLNSLVLNSGTTDIDFRITSTNKMVLTATALTLRDGVDILPTNSTNNDIGSSTQQFENAFFDGFIDIENISTPPTPSDVTQVKLFLDDTSGELSVRKFGGITLSLEAGAAGGEVNTGNNVGSGTGQVFRDKTGVTLNFKTLLAGTNITLTNNADDITIDASGTSGATQALDNLLSVAINTSLLPENDNTIDLGSSSLEWRDLYIDGTANLDTANISTLIAGIVTSSLIPSPDNNHDLGTSTFEWKDLFIDGTANLDTANISTLIAGIVTSSLIPSPDNNRALGTTTFGWADLFLGSGGFVNFDGGTSNSISVVSGTMNLRAVTEFDFDVNNAFKLDIRSTGLVSVNIAPFSTNTYDLGSTSFRWREIFSNNSLNVSLTKFKKNITELADEDCLKVCNSLRTIEYEWKDNFVGTDDNRRYVGFDVDELEKLLPNAVKGDMFYPNAVIGALLGAVRHLEQKITELSS